MIHIFLDANFLFIPVQFKIDIYSELERILSEPFRMVVISAVFTEIEIKVDNERKKLQINKNLNDNVIVSKFERQYILARKILESHPYTLLDRTRKHSQLVDDLILDCAIEYSNQGKMTLIASNDKQLRKKSKNHNISCVFLRKKQYLSIE